MLYAQPEWIKTFPLQNPKLSSSMMLCYTPKGNSSQTCSPDKVNHSVVPMDDLSSSCKSKGPPGHLHVYYKS